ncbi:MAG: gliding motility-associated C-terminal domain-containing protein [Sporocytophaga sp.]|uniref:gliding motility-associated C-terminal domain-containing protein n=1 Tax=Sporocytophaga sp. TaxID=2231183 RepID=UPI001B0646B6|nr:gliding motility-associated C-terminal domain-containing protein [Sporocytophaga sp.]MBO9700860.1 gliding motility-associated C-terminal domain-containing protein [Sporocytophaga sp.]
MIQIVRYFLGFILLFHCTYSWGQEKFDLSADTVCVGDLLTISDDNKPNTYYNFQGLISDTCGTIPNAITYDNYVACKSYTYKKSGTYVIDQIINSYNAKKTVVVMDKRLPLFEVHKCINNQVKILITDTYYHEYLLDYGIGPVAVKSGQELIVTLAGPTAINLTGRFRPTLCGASAIQNVTPFAVLPAPQLNKITTNNISQSSGSINLSFSVSASFNQYKIERDINYSSVFSPIDTIDGTKTNFLDENLNTESNSYCYRISAFDDCNHSTSSVTVCSSPFSVSAANNENDINWAQYQGSDFQSYEILKNNVPLSTFTSSIITTLIDTDIKCGKEDCYKLITHLTTGAVSESPLICVKGISNTIPTAINNLNSTIENNQVKILWASSISSIPKYTILKSTNGGTPEIITEVKQSPFISTVNLLNNDCYQIEFTDSCGNNSPISNQTCPVILNMEESETENILQWTPYSGFLSDVSKYIIVKSDLSGNIVKEIDAGTSLSYTDTEIDPHTSVGFTYYIKAIPVGTEILPFSQSNIKTVKYEIQIFTPTAFTPDKDGVNDIFVPKGKFFTEFEMTVFNRWGEIVFYTSNINNGWDGLYKGDVAQQDSYAYLIKAKDNRGREKVYKGTVTLLR